MVSRNDRPRSVWITVPASPELKKAVRAAADEDGRTIAAFVRRLLTKHLAPYLAARKGVRP